MIKQLFSDFRERHSEEYCTMYDICGARSDGKVLNCPVGTPAVKVTSAGFILCQVNVSLIA